MHGHIHVYYLWFYASCFMTCDPIHSANACTRYILIHLVVDEPVKETDENTEHLRRYDVHVGLGYRSTIHVPNWYTYANVQNEFSPESSLIVVTDSLSSYVYYIW